jgi:glycolate oxidase
MDQTFLNELRAIVGDDGLRDSAAQKHVYAFDAYTLEKTLPGVVVLPRNTDEVAAIARLCHRHKVPSCPAGRARDWPVARRPRPIRF